MKRRSQRPVGVLGSIPGGFLVNYVTGKILGKRENREYLQKVIGANREVVYAIRPGISEGQIPSPEILTSLLNATARRYGVEASDLYTATQIAEELVKEVMDSSFILSSQKGEYCSRLADLGVTAKRQVLEPVKELQPRAIAEYRKRLISSVSMLLGVLTATSTVMYSTLELIRSKKPNVDSEIADGKRLEFFFPVFAAMATASEVMVHLRFGGDPRSTAASTARHSAFDPLAPPLNQHSFFKNPQVPPKGGWPCAT